MKSLNGNKQNFSKIKILEKYNHMIQIKKMIKIMMIYNSKKIISLAMETQKKFYFINKINNKGIVKTLKTLKVILQALSYSLK